VHLHGLGPGECGLELSKADGRLPDHRPFDRDAAWFVELAPLLAEFDGVVVAEVFSWPEAELILNCLEEIIKPQCEN
jgi:hypothetical protein